MFRCDQCDNGIAEGEPCLYCGAPAQWDYALDEFERERDEVEPGDDPDFDRNESIHDRSERRADEVLRYDGSERGRA